MSCTTTRCKRSLRCGSARRWRASRFGGETPDPARASERLGELIGLIDDELVNLRRLIGDLRPIYLEDLGFVPALEMLVQQTQARYGLEVQAAG